MEKYTRSLEGLRLHYLISEERPTALVFVHGSLGNAHWWDAQAAYFRERYQVVQLDLSGHGKSEAGRCDWTAEAYAADIKAVLEELSAERIVLVGHSMSGPYAMQASLQVPAVRMLLLVDTVKDLENLMDEQMAEELIFTRYRQDFRKAVEEYLPRYLFSASTPEAVRLRLQREFLAQGGDFAVRSLAPLYRMDLRGLADRVSLPVRAIVSDSSPLHEESVRRHLRDYDFLTISGTGHYPMLEQPDEFNRCLDRLLQEAGF